MTLDSGYKNALKVHIGDNIVKFKYNDDGLCLSKPDNIFLGKWPKRKKEYY